MLVLTRKPGEEIIIGENIRVVYLSGGGQARIGIDAPKDVNIRRAELPALTNNQTGEQYGK